MKFPFRPKLLLPLILGAGALGAALRAWLLHTGIDSRGLLLRAHPGSYLPFILTAAVMAVLYLFLRPMTGVPAYKRLFPRSAAAAIGCLAAAAGILISDLYEFTPADSIRVISCILGIAAAGCLIYLAVCRLRNLRPAPGFHSCVTVYLMVHLLSQYRTWNSEPQLQLYVFDLLASVFLMFFAYRRTTLDAGSGSRRWYVFFRFGALFFCLLAIPGGNWLFYLCMAVWTAADHCSLRPERSCTPMELPEKVLYCLNALERAGFEAYVVGGCVRDALLGLTPHDYDMCTSATPEQIAQVFSSHRLVRSGEIHGTIGVILEDEVFEITTFRTEGGYSDSRHPDWVEFVTDLNADLARRDFTVNAMAYAPDWGYIDPWGGQRDLHHRILRTVGDGAVRFQEDPLRILRGVRFAVCYGLTPDPSTQKAMLDQAYLMDNLARERVFSELCKLIVRVNAQDLLRYAPIITQVIPELEASVGFDQHSPHHAHDVYTHIALTVQSVPDELPLRLAALLHDAGKPQVFSQDETGRGHFYEHAKVSARIAEQVLLRLKAPTALCSQVVFLVERHMTPLEPERKLLLRRLSAYGEEGVRWLLSLQRADFCSKGVDNGEAAYFDQIETLLNEICAEAPCLTAKDLAVHGDDLLSLGLEPGPHIGEGMRFLLQQVLDDILPNTREALMDAARDFYNISNQEEQL